MLVCDFYRPLKQITPSLCASTKEALKSKATKEEEKQIRLTTYRGALSPESQSPTKVFSLQGQSIVPAETRGRDIIFQIFFFFLL